MAYKFQLGAFTASGSIKAEDGFNANDQNITNVGDIAVDSVSADGNDLTISLTDNRAASLDITQGGNSYLAFDTQDSGGEVIIASKKVRIADDTKLTFGAGDDASFEYDEDGNDVLLYAGANIRIPDDTKIEFGAGGDAGIEYDENGTDQLRIHGATAGIVLQIPGGDAMTIDSSANVTIAGNLTVQGETTTVDSTTINISSSFTFEGPADAHETTLHCGTPTQDLQINLPQFSASAGAATYHMAVLADATTAASAQVTAAEFALLDGGSSVGTTALASGDGFLHNDNGTMKQTSIDKIADFFAGDALEASSGVLAVAVDDSSIEINSDAIRVKASGITNAMLAGSIADSKLNTISTAGKVDLAALEIDGGTDIGEALVDADLFIVDNGAGGTNRKCAMSRLKTYIGAGSVTVTAHGDADRTLVVGVNYASANTSTARTWTLPGSPSVGDSVKVKVAGVSSGAVTIARAGSQTIDGSLTSIVLESDNAAVELVYVAADDWRVF